MGEIGEFLNSNMTNNHDSCSEVYTNSDTCTFRYTLETPKFDLNHLF